jgi:hypothetical protein
MADYQAQLDEVTAAITAVLTKGQHFRIGDREYWRGDLVELRQRETMLRNLVNKQKRGGLRVSRGIPL